VLFLGWGGGARGFGVFYAFIYLPFLNFYKITNEFVIDLPNVVVVGLVHLVEV